LQESVGVIIKHKPRRIQMPPITWQDIAEAVARGWTKHETEGTVMDPVLGEAITQEVATLFNITDYRKEEPDG